MEESKDQELRERFPANVERTLDFYEFAKESFKDYDLSDDLIRALAQIDKARYIVESKDETPAMTIGFDQPVTLSAEEMINIASALYLAEWHLDDLIRKTESK
jgi:hypothetical protein